MPFINGLLVKTAILTPASCTPVTPSGNRTGCTLHRIPPIWAALLESVMTSRTCPACKGERLRAEIRAVTVGRKRLPEVLAAHGDTIRVLHTLRPVGVAMAGIEEFDPYKD